MRRVLAIVIVAALALTLSAGTAFASACAIAPCGAMKSMAAPSANGCCSASVAQEPCGSGAPVSLGARCDMRSDRQAGDASSPPRTAPEISSATVADVLVLPALFGSSAVTASVAADARGAPHLSAVIRI